MENKSYTFGGSGFLRIFGTFIGWIANLVKWAAIFLITRFNVLSKWLVGVSTKMLLNSEKHELIILKIEFPEIHTKRIKFTCDNVLYYCYENSITYRELYKEYKNNDKVVEITDIDYIWVKEHPMWIAL